MSAETVPLGALIKPAGLLRAGGDKLPILSMTMHGGLVDQSGKFKKRIASADTSQYKVVRRNQLVVGFPIDEGVLSFQRHYDQAIVSPAYDVWDLSDSTKIEARYLERFLRSPRALAFYSAKLRGTTARRRTLPKDIFLSLPVTLPSLDEQRRVADVLDRAEGVRAKRQEALARLDALTESVFRDMFGDLLVNDHSWPVRKVADFVAGFESGKNLVAGDAENSRSRFRVLKVSAVTELAYRPAESKALPEGYAPPERHFVRVGDLLFSRANTTELIGATALVHETPENILLPDKLWRFVWHEPSRADPRFVLNLFQQQKFRHEIGRRATGTSESMKNISQGKVLSIPVGFPPLELQRRFGERVAGVERVKTAQRGHLAELDALFESLQDRAFRGIL